MSEDRPDLNESWDLFVGTGEPDEEAKRRAGKDKAWLRIPDPPSWRLREKGKPPVFEMKPELARAVNAALRLRRPLLITGGPGSGKSTLVDVIAHELELGPVLRWHITSKSTLNDGLYEYDALGRLHATQETSTDAAPENFVRLGPLGTALATDTIRAVLIDELDKSDLDLPGDLLNVIEDGEFTIPVLARAKREDGFTVKGADGDTGQDGLPYTVSKEGVVKRRQFPVIVFTSNRERAFSAPFLRRCVRFEMPPFTPEDVANIVTRHLDEQATADEQGTIPDFARKLQADKQLAINQILEYVFLVTGSPKPDSQTSEMLKETLLKELNGT
jgi:MoxR-like ATPase